MGSHNPQFSEISRRCLTHDPASRCVDQWRLPPSQKLRRCNLRHLIRPARSMIPIGTLPARGIGCNRRAAWPIASCAERSANWTDHRHLNLDAVFLGQCRLVGPMPTIAASPYLPQTRRPAIDPVFLGFLPFLHSRRDGPVATVNSRYRVEIRAFSTRHFPGHLSPRKPT
jgi:hypothetical protein